MAATQVRKSALVMQPAPTMFDLIEGAEHYPQFLPWCAGATILVRDDSVVAADIHVDYRGLRFTMRTRNPKRKPEFMAIHLERGPFRRFYGEWRLRELTPEACKVEFELQYEFDSSIANRLAGPLFAKMADTLVDAFVRRAHALPAAAPSVPAAVTVPPAAVAAPPAPSPGMPAPDGSAPPASPVMPEAVAPLASTAPAPAPAAEPAAPGSGCGAPPP